MPYVIQRRGDEYCVHLQNDDGSAGAQVQGGCHPTEEEARAHQRALYSNVPDARTAAVEVPCSCRHNGTDTPVILGAATGPLEERFPVPAYPPASWYTERPDWLEPGMKLSVDDGGRVAGYFFQHGQCLVHDSAACPRPSPTRYAAFHQNEVVTAEGEALRVGVIGNVNGHADPYARVDVAQAHYADPDRQLMAVRAYDDEHGGYILGAMVPHATYADVALVRRSALSGDWRPMPPSWWRSHGIQANVVRDCEGFDCIGPTLVTRPGLPLVRQFDGGEFVMRDGTHRRAAAVLGGLGGIQLEEEIMPTQTAPGPHPVDDSVEARLARVEALVAQPPPGAPNGTPEEPAAEGLSLEEIDARVSRLEEVVGQIVGAMEEQMAATTASLPPADEADPWYEYEARTAAQFTTAQRDKMAGGAAMEDGSFPVRNRADLQNAIQALGRANNPDAVKAHLCRRAASIGEMQFLKDHTSWAADTC